VPTDDGRCHDDCEAIPVTLTDDTSSDTRAGNGNRTQEDSSADAGERSGRKGSLQRVLDVIPPEAYERPTHKGMGYFIRDLVVYGVAVALLVLVDHPVLVVAGWVLASLAVSALFIVGHDAAHGALFASRRLNRTVGRIAMLPSWHVYEGWALGHNRIHHTYTARQGFDFVWHPVTPAEYAALSPAKKLRHRIEWSWLGAGAYYLREVWWNKMIIGRPPARFAGAIRRDRRLVGTVVIAVAAALAALGAYRYGTPAGAAWMVVKVWIVPFLGFGYVIGSLVHIHHIGPTLRWWPRREWTRFAGQVEATTALYSSPVVEFFFHWIMVHVPHHVDVRIPMYNLPMAAEAIVANIDEASAGRLRFRDFVANTRVCKLYDFNEGTWFTYRQAAELPAEALQLPDSSPVVAPAADR
jgi:acyl-lipid omega-6 desaturase (Delta-12 desaturase)